ncbi:hypothetical protein ACFCYC_38315 [Streptomyces sp. NPDC056402]|uniref:hypothetical protein n=1 Tax=Streptomyces sp. NPDC056402 TaxID=3345810 RepID=UPI0035DB5A94
MLFTPAGPGGRLFLQTRRGSLVQDRFPDLVSAAGQLPDGLVLDGELGVWDTAVGRLSFEALQRRAAAAAAPPLCSPRRPPRSSLPLTPSRSTARKSWDCPTPSAAVAWRSSSRPAH